MTWLQMTTDPLPWLDQRIPRGSIVRFSIAGGFNSAIFYVCWAILLVGFSGVDVRLLWGLCWGATGVLAHFVHRWFTFDDRKPVTWTLSTAIPVYSFSLVGSSASIGWMTETSSVDVRILGIVNLLAWGIIVWLSMRMFVFQYSKAHASPAHQSE